MIRNLRVHPQLSACTVLEGCMALIKIQGRPLVQSARGVQPIDGAAMGVIQLTKGVDRYRTTYKRGVDRDQNCLQMGRQ